MSESRNRKSILLKISLLLLVFSVSLLFLYLKNDYYVPTELRLYGNFSDSAKYRFSWDTGNGFNDYETVDIEMDSSKEYHSIYLPYLTVYGLRLKPADSLCKGTINKIIVLSELDTNEIAFTQNREGDITVNNLEIRHTRFEPKLFGIQVFIALLFAWVFYEIITLKRRFNKPDWKSALRYIFVEGQRARFWIFFGVSFVIFFCWLLGQWPGAMTPDSLWQWLQTKTLDFQDNHPYISSIYLVVLSQIWDSPAVVAILQIILMSALGSFIFWWLGSKGLKNYIIYIFFALWVTSIPIGLFNIILWKDIPFSLLAVFWAFYCFYLYYNKKQSTKIAPISLHTIIILSVTLIITGFVRHNGVLFLLLIPAVFFIFKLIERKRIYLLVIITIFLFSILKYLAPTILGVEPMNPVFGSLSWKINPIASLFHNKLLQGDKTYYSDDYERDKRIFGKMMNVDSIKKYYSPEHGGPLVVRIRTDINQEDVDSINNLFYKLVIANFPAYLSDRAYLFAAMTCSFGSSIYSNYIIRDDYIHSEIKSYNWVGGLTLFKYKYTPKIKQFFDLQTYIIGITGAHPLRLPIWNYLIPLFILLSALFLYKYIPGAAMSSFIMLFQVPFIILTAAAPDFRYLYFIYIYSIFIIPIGVLEYLEYLKFKKEKSI